MYKVIFFDLDDTLWDFQANAKVAMKQLFDNSKLNDLFPAFEFFYDKYQVVNHELWRCYSNGSVSKEKLMVDRFLIPLTEAGCNDVDLACSLGDEYLNLLALQSILVDNALQMLTFLKPYYRLAVVSNGFKEVQYNKLKRSNIISFFEEIILSDEIGYNKPDPNFFSIALKRMNVDNSEAVVVGDNYDTDIVGAFNANIDSVFFNRYYEDCILYPKATHVISNLTELKRIFPIG
ncbi:MAG: YjjG family noncanonical pyrimidine nucleotidase [Candidatus Aphodosoma sp.]